MSVVCSVLLYGVRFALLQHGILPGILFAGGLCAHWFLENAVVRNLIGWGLWLLALILLYHLVTVVILSLRKTRPRKCRRCGNSRDWWEGSECGQCKHVSWGVLFLRGTFSAALIGGGVAGSMSLENQYWATFIAWGGVVLGGPLLVAVSVVGFRQLKRGIPRSQTNR